MIKIFGATDKNYTSNGDIVLQSIKAKLERLQELNGIKDIVRGQEVNKAIRKEGITESNELAILRKQVMALCNALNVVPNEDFTEYFEKVEEIKKGV